MAKIVATFSQFEWMTVPGLGNWRLNTHGTPMKATTVKALIECQFTKKEASSCHASHDHFRQGFPLLWLPKLGHF